MLGNEKPRSPGVSDPTLRSVGVKDTGRVADCSLLHADVFDNLSGTDSQSSSDNPLPTVQDAGLSRLPEWRDIISTV